MHKWTGLVKSFLKLVVTIEILSHTNNVEIVNPRNWSGTICKPTFKAWLKTVTLAQTKAPDKGKCNR